MNFLFLIGECDSYRSTYYRVSSQKSRVPSSRWSRCAIGARGTGCHPGFCRWLIVQPLFPLSLPLSLSISLCLSLSSSLSLSPFLPLLLCSFLSPGISRYLVSNDLVWSSPSCSWNSVQNVPVETASRRLFYHGIFAAVPIMFHWCNFGASYVGVEIVTPNIRSLL